VRRARPTVAPCRIAGDDPAAKAAVTEFLDAIGYDTVDAGTAAAGGVDAQVRAEHPQQPEALDVEPRGVGPYETRPLALTTGSRACAPRWRQRSRPTGARPLRLTSYPESRREAHR
jgi:hypothetical protein